MAINIRMGLLWFVWAISVGEVWHLLLSLLVGVATLLPLSVLLTDNTA